MRQTASIAGLIVGLFFVVRTIAEPFVIDTTDPATTRLTGAGPAFSACCRFTAVPA